MMALEALIFDVDGTLADTEEAHRQAFNAAFIELELWWDWGPQLYAQLLRVSGGKERIAHYIETLPVTATERAQLRELVSLIHSTKTRIYKELVENFKLPLRPGAAKLIRDARAAGLKLAIASTTTQANIEPLLTAALGRGAMSWFATISSGDIVANKKPAPDIYRLALQGLRLPADRCIAFEDSVNGLKAARAAGLFTVVTPTRWNIGQDFRDAQLVLESFEDIDLPKLRQLHSAARAAA
jgi:beta-phosphoglucomutase-like phosphatase (HAD superfamily)